MKKKSAIEEVIDLKENKKFKNTEIAKKLGISINTVEKSLQLGRLHKECRLFLSDERYEKLLSLKYKALDLKSIKGDSSVVIKFIDSIDVGASAKAIREKLSLVEVRQEKLSEIKTDIEQLNNSIDNCKNEVKTLDKQYKDMLKEIDSIFKFILEDKELKDDKKVQLLSSIAYNKKHNAWHFVGYVDYKVYKYLMNKDYIKKPQDYWGNDNIPIILDIDSFINYVKRSKTFRSSFQSRYSRRHNLIWAKKGDKELKEINDVKNRLADRKKELSKLKRSLNKVVNSDLNDFETVLEAKNELAKKDILKHNELCLKGMRWLKEQGYIADIEYTHGNYRFDVIGVNPKNQDIVILEAKVSMSDYKQDKKMEGYIDFCNRIYVITNNYKIVDDMLYNHNIMGCIYINDLDEIKIYNDFESRDQTSIDPEEVTYNIYNKLWSKIYKI